MNAFVLIIIGAVATAACLAIYGKKVEMMHEDVNAEVLHFLGIVYTTHDMADFELISTLKTAIINNAKKVMDTTKLQEKLDQAVRNQITLVADEMVRSGRIK